MEGALYDIDNIRRCVVAGFFANAAYLHPSGSYRTVRNDHELHIHPASVLYAEKPPPWYVSQICILYSFRHSRNQQPSLNYFQGCL